jgi:fatty-acyl-CoA synthase
VVLGCGKQGPLIGAFLQHFVTEGRISKFALPDRFVVVPTLAWTSVGKIDEKAVRLLYPR